MQLFILMYVFFSLKVMLSHYEPKTVTDIKVFIKNNKSSTNIKLPQDIVHPENYHD